MQRQQQNDGDGGQMPAAEDALMLKLKNVNKKKTEEEEEALSSALAPELSATTAPAAVSAASAQKQRALRKLVDSLFDCWFPVENNEEEEEHPDEQLTDGGKMMVLEEGDGEKEEEKEEEENEKKKNASASDDVVFVGQMLVDYNGNDVLDKEEDDDVFGKFNDDGSSNIASSGAEEQPPTPLMTTAKTGVEAQPSSPPPITKVEILPTGRNSSWLVPDEWKWRQEKHQQQNHRNNKRTRLARFCARTQTYDGKFKLTNEGLMLTCVKKSGGYFEHIIKSSEPFYAHQPTSAVAAGAFKLFYFELKVVQLKGADSFGLIDCNQVKYSSKRKTFNNGDVIGCGLLVSPRRKEDFEEGKKQQQPFPAEVFFTYNGELRAKRIPVPLTVQHLYPFVAMSSDGDRVVANFGGSDKPFRYDLNTYQLPSF